MPNDISACGLLIESLTFNEKGEPIWPTKMPNSKVESRTTFSGFCMPVIKEVNFEQNFNDILQQKQKIKFER